MRNRLPRVRSKFSLSLFLRKNYTTILAGWDETKTQLPGKIEKIVTKTEKSRQFCVTYLKIILSYKKKIVTSYLDRGLWLVLSSVGFGAGKNNKAWFRDSIYGSVFFIFKKAE
jgi:hypothetical protein